MTDRGPLTHRFPSRPRRRPLVEVAAFVVVVTCYVLLATRGEALGWLWP